MKKRILLVFVVIALIVSLSACGKGGPNFVKHIIDVDTLVVDTFSDFTFRNANIDQSLEVFALQSDGSFVRQTLAAPTDPELSEGQITVSFETVVDNPGVFEVVLRQRANVFYSFYIVVRKDSQGDPNYDETTDISVIAPQIRFIAGLDSNTNKINALSAAITPLIANAPTFNHTAVVIPVWEGDTIVNRNFAREQLDINDSGFIVNVDDLDTIPDSGEIAPNGNIIISSAAAEFEEITISTYTRRPSNNLEVPIQMGTAGFWDWVFIIPLAWLLSFIGGLLGNSFAWGIIIGTILIRTLAWPIYAKGNDSTLKMQLAQPELTRIQAKYANKKDPASKQKQQMEQMAIYKKHGISIFGCLTPLIQMPIFIAMFQVVQRLPIPGGMFAERVSNYYTFFGLINLSSGGWTDPAAIVLSLIVGSTMLALNIISTRKPNYTKNTGTQVKPAQAVQTERTMKIVMYVMIVFMVFASIQSNALALYWVVGNIFSIGQTLLNRKINEKKFRRKNDEMMGVITAKPKRKFKDIFKRKEK